MTEFLNARSYCIRSEHKYNRFDKKIWGCFCGIPFCIEGSFASKAL